MTTSRIGAWRTSMWMAIGGLLLLPAIAMQFTSEVAWDRADFAAAAIVLVGMGIAVELGLRTVRSQKLRAISVMAIVAVAVFIWADAAVGIV